MKKLCVCLVFCFFSCIKDQPGISILNNSDTVYDSIQVFSSEHIKTVFKDVQPGDKIDGIISFNNEDTGDGCYKLLLFKNGKVFKNECFGYYTNGKSLNRKFNITIETDTIKIKSK